MSKNEKTIYIFIRANQGRGAYEITNVNGITLHNEILNVLLDKEQNQLKPLYVDWEVIIKSLEYVRDNRNKKGIPGEPTIFIFTTFENNYHIATKIKNHNNENFKNYLKTINILKQQLKRSSSILKEDDNIKFHYIPDNFENKMEQVNALLGHKARKKPS